MYCGGLFCFVFKEANQLFLKLTTLLSIQSRLKVIFKKDIQSVPKPLYSIPFF